jgi:hypothetical protein
MALTAAAGQPFAQQRLSAGERGIGDALKIRERLACATVTVPPRLLA